MPEQKPKRKPRKKPLSTLPCGSYEGIIRLYQKLVDELIEKRNWPELRRALGNVTKTLYMRQAREPAPKSVTHVNMVSFDGKDSGVIQQLRDRVREISTIPGGPKLDIRVPSGPIDVKGVDEEVEREILGDDDE